MQFSEGQLGVKFKPFSKYPPCYNDISFWINDSFTENNLCELVRGIAGDLVEEAIFLIFAAKPLLHFMGVNYNYLTLRSLGAPAVLLSLAMQGVFQGFKDTKTPLYATLAGDLTNIALDPLFMFVFRLGVSAAAIAHVVSQYLISVILLWKLMQKVDLMPPSINFELFILY
ncbi:protein DETOXIFICATION 42-like isoform X2 [Arachis ipaensis]|uniref:protein DETOXIFICATION 42-like isoform X2 n=1 Tax=Arachis ipaensis TaxID=130454 RepID=UPI000A2B1890|nr:protein DETOXIFICATION 42-like isoform X2 [Arachis ipaensis]XP_025684069.1 protein DETOXIFICATION 42 isoform X2 [Arachis hypogaea]QHN82083.1 Protein DETOXIFICATION [Arachis hypogaea]